MGVALPLAPSGGEHKYMSGVRDCGPGPCLAMNRIPINCGGGRRAHKEKISVSWIRVFGQKVGAEISSSGLCEGGQRRI